MDRYFHFSEEHKGYLEEQLNSFESHLSSFATSSKSAVRKYTRKKSSDFLRSDFSIDVDKILHNPLYNRYTDKTQVFSFFKNDDISRRAIHVQLVSRIAYVIGRALKLNTDLVEAIALGHDIGHTPFGHKGEEFLSELYFEHCGRYFRHNIHSVRVLMTITNSNLTLQTYDGILCHCGEKVYGEYYPHKLSTFPEFEANFERCYTEPHTIDTLHPCTLEGCVVRVSDVIAYVGKDRQDAYKAGLTKSDMFSDDNIIGRNNADIINNVISNIVKNSIGKEYLKMDLDVFKGLEKARAENFDIIYGNEKVTRTYYDCIKPMMKLMYERLLEDLNAYNFASPIYQHHLNHPILGNCYRDKRRHIITNDNDIVVDYIASMTDDYFIDLFTNLFPENSFYINGIKYHGYFED